jgi:hypothetical protein
MEELKEILKQIVADLEKSAAAIEILSSNAGVELTALDLAVQKNREFYNSLRSQIGALQMRRPAKARQRAGDTNPAT